MSVFTEQHNLETTIYLLYIILSFLFYFELNNSFQQSCVIHTFIFC